MVVKISKLPVILAHSPEVKIHCGQRSGNVDCNWEFLLRIFALSN